MDYLFSMNGGSNKVTTAADPLGQSYLNGYTNIGNQSLTNSTAYTLATPGAVPEPATSAMMLLGPGLVGGAPRSRRRPNTPAALA